MLDALQLLAAFFAGLLAGEELAVRLGVRGPLARLDTAAHVAMRQGLIRTLRVVVPVLYAATLLSGLGALALHWGAPGTGARIASVLLLAAFMAVTLGGTVPINQAALAWDPAAPPPGWQAMVRRWERLDDIRTVLAVAAFALALVAARP